MTLYVNNFTAMRFWSLVTASLDEVTKPCKAREVRRASTSLARIDVTPLEAIVGPMKRIHILIDDERKRTKSPRLVYHHRSLPYPFGAFRRRSPQILIASPELSFFEMASYLPLAKLVEYGFLICGTYTVNPNAVKANDRPQLTSKRKLAAFIRGMGKARGCAIARKALELVVEGSASPRETKTAILLCFPVKLGGYGFDQPVMNYRVDFSPEEQRLFGKTHVVLDLYWPEYHFGIEYDGSETHSDDGSVSRDRQKDSELSYRGIKVIRVDKQQLADPFQVYVLARKCARQLGKRIRRPTPQQVQKRRALFELVVKNAIDSKARKRRRTALTIGEGKGAKLEAAAREREGIEASIFTDVSCTADDTLSLLHEKMR